MTPLGEDFKSVLTGLEFNTAGEALSLPSLVCYDSFSAAFTLCLAPDFGKGGCLQVAISRFDSTKKH